MQLSNVSKQVIKLCGSARPSPFLSLSSRPWFVETSSPSPKDVVIVIDSSESMGTADSDGRDPLDIAKEAAKSVLGTFNLNDRVHHSKQTLIEKKAPIYPTLCGHFYLDLL